jgi:hypothetical protein
MENCSKCNVPLVILGPWKRCEKCGFFINTIDKRTPKVEQDEPDHPQRCTGGSCCELGDCE